MKGIKASELAKAVGGELLRGDPKSLIFGASIDTRNIKPGEFFVPLSGEQTDGHDHILEAVSSGCAGFFIADDRTKRILSEVKESDVVVIEVQDVLSALQDWARALRTDFTGTVIGITGSTGKTTTKDMLGAILNKSFQVAVSPMNYNNEIGVPLSIISAPRDAQVMVLEFGMRGLGEIELLCKIARPHIAIITNIGQSHFELLRSYENIAKAKGEIIENLPGDGVAILNADDSFFSYHKCKVKGQFLSFGVRNPAHVFLKSHSKRANSIHELDIIVGKKNFPVSANLIGEHNIYNLLAAIAAADHLGMAHEDIHSGIDRMILSANRMRVIKVSEGIYIIDDCYNASPDSMKAAIKTLSEFVTPGKRFAVLGDMLELGPLSEEAHQEIGRFVAKCKVDFLFTLGKHSQQIAETALKHGMNRAQVHAFSSEADVIDILSETLEIDDVVLFKASRKLAFENMVLELIEYFEGFH